MAIAKRKRVENYIIIGAFAALTLFIAVFAVITLLPVFTVNSYSDMKEITYSELLTKEKRDDKGYYVFFIDENDNDCQELEAAATSFAEYMRTNETEKVYIIYTNKRENSDSTYSTPTLVYVYGRTVKNTYKTYSDIINHFNDKIKK